MLVSNHRLKGAVAIVIASLLWGTTGTAASYAPNISPLAIGAFAMGFGGVLLCLVARNSLVQDVKKLRSNPAAVIFGSLCVAIYPLAFYSSMRLSGVAIGTIVSIASAPLFAVLLERLFSKKAISLQWCVSFLLGASGIAMLAVGKTSTEAVQNNLAGQQLGVLLGLLAGLTYAGYSWAAKQLIDKQVKSTSAMACLFGCAATVLLPSLFFTGSNLFVSGINTSVVLYMAVIPMFLGYLLFGFGLKTTEASTATLITLIEPLVAALLAIYVLGEQFKPIGWGGMVLVCFCLIVQTIKFKPERQGAASLSAES